MEKDVVISIKGMQNYEDSDPDTIELVTEGRLTRDERGYTLTYQESELTGLEGTRTMLKMDGATVSIIRTGTYPSELLFAEDQRHVGLYQTDFGALTISTHTRRLENTIGADGGQLAIEYTVEVDNSMVGEHA